MRKRNYRLERDNMLHYAFLEQVLAKGCKTVTHKNKSGKLYSVRVFAYLKELVVIYCSVAKVTALHTLRHC
jgi:hypothetical protein